MTTATSELPVWRLAWNIAQWRPRLFRKTAALWICFYLVPLLTGWFGGRAFSAVQQGDLTATLVWAFGLFAAEVIQFMFLYLGVLNFIRLWVYIESLLQGNMLAAQVANGHQEAGRPVGSAGESITRFRDDTHDVAWFIDSWLDVMGGVWFTIAALAFMLTINVPATLIVLVPMSSVLLVTLTLDKRVKQYRSADRQATAAVTGFLGDAVAAATSIKVAGAAENAVERLSALTDRRRYTAVRDRVLEDVISVWGAGSIDMGLALVIIASAGAIASGSFGLGALATFLGLLFWLSNLPRMAGRMLARRKQAQVAFEGMRELVADQDPARVAQHRHLPIGASDRDLKRSAPARQPLERLDVVELGASYTRTGKGVAPTSFSMDRGSFTVVTGAVGSGKSTLLKSLVGLLWSGDDLTLGGEVFWNGALVTDRAAFFQPPQAAYLAQVPQLLSDSVADNILLGLGQDPERTIDDALALAAVDDDINLMPAGLDTLIGPRGLRLSGGQRQRVAAARAFVHGPEIVILDDLSSALDVETEVRLWTNLAEAGVTVLAVSHRQVAFDRADQIITLG